MIRYRANLQKILEALVWLASERPGLSFYYVAKILYFADKDHLSRYGRPILGDRYIAMEHGPVPSIIYDMLRFNPFLDPDLFDAVSRSIRVVRDGIPTVSALRPPDTSLLSRTDVGALRAALDEYGSMTVSELRRLTHEERAYREAPANAEMDYALILADDIPDREDRIRDLEAASGTLAL